jgi:hypothetical protein
MTDTFKVNYEYLDFKNRVIDKRSRDKATLTLRRVSNQNEIRIKSPRGLDVFIFSESTILIEKSSDNNLCVWVPTYKLRMTLQGPSTLLIQIQQFLENPPVEVESAISPESQKSISPTDIISKLTPPQGSVKGKRIFGIVAKDLFGTGFTPQAKTRDPKTVHLPRTLVNSAEKAPKVLANNEKQAQPKTYFMGLLVAAASDTNACGKGRGNQRNNSSSNTTDSNKENFVLTAGQLEVLQACKDGKNVFYTGGAGTGKSSLLTTIIEELMGQYGRSKVFVAATTGLAACAVGGTTVHQFAGISTLIDENLTNPSEIKAQQTRIIAQVMLLYACFA